MDEITLRLPTATTTALRAEADERGVTVEEHLRDIVDAYRADGQQRVGRTIEYVHTVANDKQVAESSKQTGQSEEIGSFRYGSRSILSK
jgi:hypothetical protein